MTTRLNFSARMGEPPEARLNPGGGNVGPFATVDFGDTWLSFDNPDEADAWADAFTEASRLLREAQGRAS